MRVIGLILVVAVMLMAPIAQAGDALNVGRVALPDESFVRSPAGDFISPKVGETIPGAAIRDSSGKCQFNVLATNISELEMNGDNCVVIVLKKGKPSKSLDRQPETVQKLKDLTVESSPWFAPEPSELSGAPTNNRQRSGTSQNVDPAIISTPGPQSKANQGIRRYDVLCPRIQVVLRGWMSVSRLIRRDDFNRDVYYQIAKIYPRARFYKSLNNGGLGSVRPYKFPRDWAAWNIFYQELTHFIFRGFRGVGPLEDGPSHIKIFAIGYFSSNVGKRENLEIAGYVDTYRDMVVYHECRARGALVGINRLSCRGYGRYVRPAEC